MRRPITTLMLVVALISGGVLAYNRMRVDIFPSLNIPKIYVFLDYVGMSPDQMEGFIVNQLELYFQYVDGIKDIDTRNIQQVALCELSFFPGTDMGQAMAQVVAMSDRAMSWMPKGTLPPMIMRMDAGSVPVGYLVFESEVTSLGAMGDLAQNVIRPLVQKYVPGTVAISPFGPNMRSIVVNVDPQKLLRLQPDSAAGHRRPGEGEHGHPGGEHLHQGLDADGRQQRDGRRHPDSWARSRSGWSENVYLRDVATIQDDTDITYGYALVNGKKSVYLPIIKKDTGSTLTVVADIHKSMQTVPRRRPQGRDGQLRVRRVAHRGGGRRERGHRGPDRRGPDRADDPPVPRRPAERDRRRGQHPAGPAGVVVRALADGQHDQHHVAGRHGAGDRHPRRRGDGDHRELARADGADAEDRHGGAARQQRHGRAAAAGACCASCRCSSRRSS